LAPLHSSTDDEVMSWLSGSESGTSPEATQAGLPIAEKTGIFEPPVASPRPVVAAAQSKPADPPDHKPEDQLTLRTIDAMGAYFGFPARMLNSPAFRAAFPRQCCQCLSEKELKIHLVPWPNKLNEHTARSEKVPVPPPSLPLKQLLAMEPLNALAYLPMSENLPHPFNLPFPYYVCAHCSPSGLLLTTTSPGEDGERCWLSIFNLRIALRFLAAARGTDNDDYRKLASYCEDHHKDPWQSLPLGMQNRLAKWFKLKPGERFLDYLHDEDFSKMEGGLAGVVITDQRIVFHKFQAHREFTFDNELQIRRTDEAGQLKVEIFSMLHGKAVFRTDEKAWAALCAHVGALNGNVTISQ